MIRHEIAALVRGALTSAQHKGTLAESPSPDVIIERPQRPEHGDYATSAPLRPGPRRESSTAGYRPRDRGGDAGTSGHRGG